jgi:hypothetical protein
MLFLIVIIPAALAWPAVMAGMWVTAKREDRQSRAKFSLVLDFLTGEATIPATCHVAGGKRKEIT